MTNNIVQFQFQKNTIRTDGLINITALSTAYRIATGKRKDTAKWLATSEATESIAYLASLPNIGSMELVITKEGGNGGGTWVHPKLAEIFAQWCSVEYRFAVVQLIEQAKEDKPQISLPQDYISALKALVAAEEEKQLQSAQIAILEAETERQAEVIDELFDYSSIVRIAIYNKISEKSFNWRQLKAASTVKGLEIKQAPCPRYVTKNLYHHDVWRLAYPGIALPETTTLVLAK